MIPGLDVCPFLYQEFYHFVLLPTIEVSGPGSYPIEKGSLRQDSGFEDIDSN